MKEEFDIKTLDNKLNIALGYLLSNNITAVEYVTNTNFKVKIYLIREKNKNANKI